MDYTVCDLDYDRSSAGSGIAAVLLNIEPEYKENLLYSIICQRRFSLEAGKAQAIQALAKVIMKNEYFAVHEGAGYI